MGRTRKLQRQPRQPTYEIIYTKIKDAKILSQSELLLLASMKRNARQVNERAIVKEKRIIPTMEEVKEIVKKASNKSDAEIIRDAYSQITISHLLQVSELARYPATTPEQIANVGKKYFELCEKNVITPTSSGLARALGLQRKELLEIVNGERNVLHRESYLDLWQMLEIYDEAMMKQGKINAIVGIFNQKNNHGWVDKVEVVRGSPSDQTDEEIKKKYVDVIEVESKD